MQGVKLYSGLIPHKIIISFVIVLSASLTFAGLRSTASGGSDGTDTSLISTTAASSNGVGVSSQTADSSQGFVEICKYGGSGVSGFFSFTIEGVFVSGTEVLNTFVIPVGFCSGPIPVQWNSPPGPGSNTTLKVTEIGKADFQLASVSVNPSSMQSGPLILGSKGNADGSVTADNLGGGVVEVRIYHSTTPAIQTVIGFYNRTEPSSQGFVEICKYGGSEVSGYFSFTIEGIFISGTEGLQTFVIPVGSCSGPIPVKWAAPPGPTSNTTLTITEIGTPGFALESVSVNPSNMQAAPLILGSKGNANGSVTANNPGGGVVEVLVYQSITTAIETVVSFHNGKAAGSQGFIEICKNAVSGPGGSGVSGPFYFTIEGFFAPGTQEFYTVGLFAGACSGTIPIHWEAPPGPASSTTVKITEIGKPGFALESVLVDPPGMLSAPLILDSKANADGSVTANNPGGGVVEVQVYHSMSPAIQTVVDFYNRTAPVTQGFVEICKQVSNTNGDISNRIFRFAMAGNIFQVPPGQCSGPIPVPLGLIEITELDSGWFTTSPGTWIGGFQLTSVTKTGPGTFNLIDLANRTVDLTVAAAGMANTTALTFTNQKAGSTTTAIHAFTSPGANVVVPFVDPITGTQQLNLTFQTVSIAGVTTLTTSTAGPAIPSSFSLGDPPVFYDIETTATFSGSIAVCFDLGTSGFPPAADLRLLHFESGAWADVTTSVYANTICGRVTSLSPFAIVRDSIPPSLNVILTPNVIWPPNNKMVNITASISAGDNFDPSPQIRLISITANEPLKTGDIQGASYGTDDRAFQLKATRTGKGAGRIYTITYRATDRSGNVKVTTATVTVPHDQGQ